MNSEDICNINFLTLIAGRNQKEVLLTALANHGARLINTLYGKGSVKAGFLRDMLGLVPEENKVLITCLISDEKSAAIFKMLTEDFHFDKPNTGIAFTIPIDKLSF